MEENLLQGYGVLVVEDDEFSRQMTKQTLESNGALVYEAINGQEGIDTLEKHCAEINIVLMDVTMPVMDGLTAIRLLRAKPQFAEFPIIALTSKTLKTDRDQCMKAGASDYLSKPATSTRILATIGAWLWSVEQRVEQKVEQLD